MLAAAAVMIAATAATVVGVVSAAIATAVAQQEDENDDPTDVAAAETVITHNDYLREITCDFRRSFQVIPRRRKCYSFVQYFVASVILRKHQRIDALPPSVREVAKIYLIFDGGSVVLAIEHSPSQPVRLTAPSMRGPRLRSEQHRLSSV